MHYFFAEANMGASQPVPSAKPSVLWINIAQQVNCEVPGLLVPFPAILTRISEQGAWVRAEIDVEVGKPLRLDWNCRVDRALKLPGQIVTMKQEPSTLVRMYGIRFVDVPKADLEFLVR